VQPAYCSKCGDEVTFRAEIDADWTGGEDGCIACPNCGDGTKIMSKARYWGLV